MLRWGIAQGLSVDHVRTGGHGPKRGGFTDRSIPRDHVRMRELTRRRYAERPDCRHVYYGDVYVDPIAIRSDAKPWASMVAGFMVRPIGASAWLALTARQDPPQFDAKHARIYARQTYPKPHRGRG
jgi:hypothetical protein